MGTFGSIISGAGAGASMGSVGGPWGTAAGAVIGGVAGLIGGQKAERTQAALDKEKEDAILKYNKNIDTISLANYPTAGYDVRSLYANGGIIPISATAGEVVGDSHGQDSDGDGQGGVQMGNGSEVESKEIVYQDPMGNTKVLSAKTGYADMARQIMSTPEYIQAEQQYTATVQDLNNKLKNESDLFKRGTLERKLETTRHPLDYIYDQQAASNEAQGISNTGTKEGQQFAYGGVDGIGINLIQDPNNTFNTKNAFNTYQGPTYNDVFPVTPTSTTINNTNSPYSKSTNNGIDFTKADYQRLGMSLADNAVNLGLTLNTPEIPKPIDVKAPSLKTTVNVNPELNAIDRSRNRNKNTILSNTANSNTAVGRIGQSEILASEMKGKILADKENRETALTNQNLMTSSQIEAGNVGRYNTYLGQQAARKAGIQQDISKNVGDISRDLANVTNDISTRDYQQNQLKYDTLKYSSGATESIILDGGVDKFILEDPGYVAQLRSTHKNRPEVLKYIDEVLSRKNSS